MADARETGAHSQRDPLASTSSFVVWDRKLGGPVDGPFTTRGEARAVLLSRFGGDLRSACGAWTRETVGASWRGVRGDIILGGPSGPQNGDEVAVEDEGEGAAPDRGDGVGTGLGVAP